VRAAVGVNPRYANAWLSVTVALVGLLGVYGIVVLSRVRVGSEVAAAAALGIALVIPLWIRWIQGRFDILEPIVFVTGVLLYYFVVSPIISILTGEHVFLGRDFLELYPEGFLAVAVAAVAMWCGYLLRAGATVGSKICHWIKSESPPRQRHIRSAAWTMTLGAVVALVTWSALSGRAFASLFLPGLLTESSTEVTGESYNYLFLTMEWLVPSFLLLVSSHGLRNRPLRYLYFGTIFLIYFSIGFRYRLVILVVSAGIIYFVRRQIRPRLSQVIAVLVVVFFVAGYVGQARDFFRTGGLSGSAEVGSSRGLFESARADTRIFEGFMAVMDAVPRRIDHAGLEPLTYVFVLPIPRQIWREKPHPEYLSKIPESFSTRGSSAAGAAIPNFGEYYLAFGWVGLVVGSMMFGLGARALWAFYREGPDNPFIQVIFAISVPFLFQVITRGYLAQIVQEWAFFVGPVLVISKLGPSQSTSNQLHSPRLSSSRLAIARPVSPVPPSSRAT
jgi:hypothetical protein